MLNAVSKTQIGDVNLQKTNTTKESRRTPSLDETEITHKIDSQNITFQVTDHRKCLIQEIGQYEQIVNYRTELSSPGGYIAALMGSISIGIAGAYKHSYHSKEDQYQHIYKPIAIGAAITTGLILTSAYIDNSMTQKTRQRSIGEISQIDNKLHTNCGHSPAKKLHLLLNMKHGKITIPITEGEAKINTVFFTKIVSKSGAYEPGDTIKITCLKRNCKENKIKLPKSIDAQIVLNEESLFKMETWFSQNPKSPLKEFSAIHKKIISKYEHASIESLKTINTYPTQSLDIARKCLAYDSQNLICKRILSRATSVQEAKNTQTTAAQELGITLLKQAISTTKEMSESPIKTMPKPSPKRGYFGNLLYRDSSSIKKFCRSNWTKNIIDDQNHLICKNAYQKSFGRAVIAAKTSFGYIYEIDIIQTKKTTKIELEILKQSCRTKSWILCKSAIDAITENQVKKAKEIYDYFASQKECKKSTNWSPLDHADMDLVAGGELNCGDYNMTVGLIWQVRTQSITIRYTINEDFGNHKKLLKNAELEKENNRSIRLQKEAKQRQKETNKRNKELNQKYKGL